MGSNYIFSLTPTFTQGLVLGQLSILLLLSLVLKYLFLESALSPQHNRTPYSASFSRREHALQKSEFTTVGAGPKNSASKAESADWFNLLLKQVCIAYDKLMVRCFMVYDFLQVVETYRSKLRNDLPGADGDEIARQRIERYANRIRPDSFVVSVQSSLHHIKRAGDLYVGSYHYPVGRPRVFCAPSIKCSIFIDGSEVEMCGRKHIIRIQRTSISDSNMSLSKLNLTCLTLILYPSLSLRLCYFTILYHTLPDFLSP